MIILAICCAIGFAACAYGFFVAYEFTGFVYMAISEIDRQLKDIRKQVQSEAEE
jgi:hypothetical protein